MDDHGDAGPGEVDVAIRVVEELRDWHETCVESLAGGPTFAEEFARAAARRRLDEQAEWGAEWGGNTQWG